jgi:tRNA (guanine37-N1)-methyltransferase
MKIDILTLFPNMFKGPFDESIIKRAQEKNLIKIDIHNLRKWTKDKYQTVDDRPYGGGAGMVMMVEPISKALRALKVKTPTFGSDCSTRLIQSCSASDPSAGKQNSKEQSLSIIHHPLTILLSPRGKLFNQQMAQRLSKYDHLILICGHYEGVDERVSQHLVDEEISIGDYVLTGGELPAMIIVDAITRLIPGVLKKTEATQYESFSKLKIENCKIENLLEYPQYTRPEEFKGWKVPEILLSGDHKKIKEWQIQEALKITKKRRPELIKNK